MTESTIVSQDTEQHVSHYRVVRRICKSSLGVVYKAQEDDSKKSVAVRVVKCDVLSDPNRARLFEREIETLKNIRHPGIARILEFGPATDNECFFASDYVRGASLGEYAKMHKCSTRDWLKLFRGICKAVHHTHQCGIVHRDLRPGNIIIDGNVNPRIVGLGVCCITDYDVGMPRNPARWLLPYRSPEQICGRRREIDVRADVYALGAILYGLLTGKVLFEADGNDNGDTDWPRIVCETAPAPPSSIKRSIDADLEAILLKAIAKKPADRYQSASALDQDIEDYLGNRPVRARPLGFVGEAARFAGRNKLLLGFAVVLLLAAVALGVQSFSSGRNADRSRHLVTKRQSEEQSTKLKASADAALAKLESAERERDVALQDLERTESESEVFKSQLQNVGDTQIELAAERDRARSRARNTEQIARFLADMFDARGSLEGNTGSIPATAILNRGAARISAEFAEHPGSRAAAAHHLGVAYHRLGQYDDAGKLLETALSLRSELFGEENKETVESMNALASALFAGNRQPDAVPILRKLTRISKQVFGDDHPKTLTAINNLAYALHGMGKLDEPETLFRKSLEARRRVLGEDHTKTAISMSNLGKVLVDQGKAQEAEPLFRGALEIFSKQFPEGHFRTTETTGYLDACLSELKE
ncbi:MAG: tetratricopeptide repeat protein [Planctomycetota bacterium]|nr:tetratricopeptide repeat protein [Planctomycetota bacterium]